MLLHLAATGTPVRLVLAVRSLTAQPTLERGIARLVRSKRVELLDVGPLGVEELAVIIRGAAKGPLDERSTEAVRRRFVGDEGTRIAADPTTADNLRAKRALAQIKTSDPRGALESLRGLAPTSIEGRLAEALTYSGAAALGFGDPTIGTAKAAECRRLALQSGDTGALVVASWAQAAAAHARGDLHSSVRADLWETHHLPQLAVRVFDGHLCITQRSLHGARPYDQVIAFANALAAEASRLGAARGHAFAVTLRGEAKLLSGKLDAAEEDLVAGARLHRAIGGATDAVRGPLETCPGCRITFAVPATIAAARAGELDLAADYDQKTEWLAQVVMRLPAWDAALDEVRGHTASDGGKSSRASEWFRSAAKRFEVAGHPLDARRCLDLLGAGG